MLRRLCIWYLRKRRFLVNISEAPPVEFRGGGELVYLPPVRKLKKEDKQPKPKNFWDALFEEIDRRGIDPLTGKKKQQT